MKKVYKYLYEGMIKELSDNEIKQLYIKAVEQSRKVATFELEQPCAGDYDTIFVKIVAIQNVLKRELKRRKLIK